MGKDANQLFHRSLFEDPALEKGIMLKGIMQQQREVENS